MLMGYKIIYRYHFLWVKFSAGFPHISNLIIKSVTNNFLAALSSNKKSFQILKSRNIFPFDIFLKAMAVSIVVTLHPSMMLACLNHLSDWLIQARLEIDFGHLVQFKEEMDRKECT